jgi:aspartyl-tRNA(Asn)/glutamyl-tRNA(Gln) amidotransferase subunit A
MPPVDRRTFLQMSGAVPSVISSAAAFSLAASPASAQATALADLTLAQAVAMIRRRTTSPVELTEACLQRINAHNPSLNAFITVTREEALASAREMEAEQRRGRWRGPLHGIPIALKDNIDTAGVRTTGASQLFENRVPAEDAEVVRRLKRAGAILLGKLNLHEFAYGGSSTVTHFGTMHNPWSPDHATGGSSGGPGVAVSAGMCFASLGTDTAGSVRMPASHCGIVGLKPTYGRVSTRGVMTLSWTLDHVGPMCKTVEDAALLLNVIAGYDVADPTTADVPVPDYTRALDPPTAKLRLGIARGPFFENLDPDVASAVDTAIGVLRGLTARVADITLPPTGNPARLWGPEAYAFHAKWITESPEKYQPGTRQALQRSADAKAADYVQALREVEQARRDIKKVFAGLDLIVTPTMKTPAPLLTGATPGGGGNNNAVFDIFGLPTISIPCGFSRDGLPIGLQITGAHWAEPTVLALAHGYEQATPWHLRRPPLA